MNLINALQMKLLQFLFTSLLRIKSEYTLGELMFQELFYDRTEGKSEIMFAIKLNKNLTIIGNPGEGKTSLMHYMFIEAKKSGYIFPIILDYRQVSPRSIFGVVSEFISEMKEYFKELERPISLEEKTTESNFNEHFNQVSKHLETIKKENMHSIKRLAIFLDDLDYMDNLYMKLLKEYFVSYSCSDKAIVILSGRKPLINNISRDDELRQAFNMFPEKISLGKIDMKNLIISRIAPFLKDTDSVRFGKTLSFKISPHISKLLRDAAFVYLKNYITKENQELNIISDEQKIFDINLGFNDIFYNYLANITGSNIRDIENLLPRFFAYQKVNENKEINFNNNFCDSYITCCSDDRNYLLDLASQKTVNKQTKKNGNSILQIVLEYFYVNTVKDKIMIESMENYGIDVVDLNKAIEILERSPYALIEPDFIYQLGIETFYEVYKINEKGKMYIDNILNRDLYYKSIKTTASTRSYRRDYLKANAK